MRAFVVLSLLAFVCASCSGDDKKGDGTSPLTDGGGSGGATATGGTSGGGAGGLGAGGSDPALCGIQSGTDDCLLCLARYCCSAIEACEADTACKGAFETQQACAESPDATSVSDCYSAFVRAANADGGPDTQPVAACILMHCTPCGPPNVL